MLFNTHKQYPRQVKGDPCVLSNYSAKLLAQYWHHMQQPTIIECGFQLLPSSNT
jgi:hypothetical protein